MLQQAVLYKEQLKTKYIEAICDPHFMFYTGSSYRDFNLDIPDNDWGTIQRVSIDKKGNLIGFINAQIDRDSRVVKQLGIINFTKKTNIIFSIDVIKFIRELRDVYNASKFEFMAYVGGEGEKIYKKFIEKHGGNIAGTFRNTQRLNDGKYYDATFFEIMREDMNF